MIPTIINTYALLLLKNSLAGAVMVCLVLAIRTIIQNKLPTRWLFWLWPLVILRFLTPWVPVSPLSFFHILNSKSVHATPQNISIPQIIETSSNSIPSILSTKSFQAAFSSNKHSSASFQPEIILFWVWIVGAMTIIIFITLQSLYFWNSVRKEKPVIRQDVLALLEQCKEQLGIHTLLCIVQSRRIQTPALMGFIRPRLVFPGSLLDTITTDDLRHILLHELAHLKRQDIFISWAMALVQVLHWFNPLVWIAARQMYRDRELACDATALSVLHPEQTRAYGTTLLNLMKKTSTRPLGVGLSGIVEKKSFVQRRIKMIASYNPRKIIAAPVFLAVLTILLVALTSAENPAKRLTSEPNSVQKQSPSTTAATKQYKVDLSVAYFDKNDDFSTPEAAYASINKLSGKNQINWKQVSAASLAQKMKDKVSADTPENWGKVLANAKILEVYQFNDSIAMVVALLPQDQSSEKIVKPFDIRFFEKENNRWLNTGNNRGNSPKDAEDLWDRKIQIQTAYQTYQADRRKIDRLVASFEKTDDFSTPESAYASINKLSSKNQLNWKQVSDALLAKKMEDKVSTDTSAEWSKVLANAKILEAYQLNDSTAMVVALLPQDQSSEKIIDPFDIRHFKKENGRWLNAGNDRVNSLNEAAAIWGRVVQKKSNAMSSSSQEPKR